MLSNGKDHSGSISDLYHRESNGHHQAHHDTTADTNGISFLTQDPDELIAEDDMYFENYREAPLKSAEEIKAAKEAEAHRKDVIIQDRKDSVRALVWWIAQGGEFPNGWEVPSKKKIMKMGSRGVEKILSDLYRESGETPEEQDEELYPEGWAETARSRYRVTVFSKVGSQLQRLHSALFRVIRGQY